MWLGGKQLQSGGAYVIRIHELLHAIFDFCLRVPAGRAFICVSKVSITTASRKRLRFSREVDAAADGCGLWRTKRVGRRRQCNVVDRFLNLWDTCSGLFRGRAQEVVRNGWLLGEES
jgi:hypothetical protein